MRSVNHLHRKNCIYLCFSNDLCIIFEKPINIILQELQQVIMNKRETVNVFSLLAVLVCVHQLYFFII
jgi:hypothetical protein